MSKALPLICASCNMVAEEDGTATPFDQQTNTRRSQIPGNVDVSEADGINEHGNENVLVFEGADGSVAHLDGTFDMTKNGHVNDLENLSEKFDMELYEKQSWQGI
uniref:Uncharacterized protein n=1 Tax=Glossina morsitans morsitans TaxID=37546 RepID=A0A1B0G310_GLOMM